MRHAATAFFVLAVFSPVLAEPFAKARPSLDVSYEASSMSVVKAMLRLANVGPDDFLVDLGCGDGRIPIAAARQHGTKGLGVDLDPLRIREAQANALKNGVQDKVTFREEDLFQTDISEASVVALFLFPAVNVKLRPRLLDLTPGTRVVSHEHGLGDWRPDKTLRTGEHAIHLWIVPAKIAGTWQIAVDGEELEVVIEQRYQRFRGWLTIEGKEKASIREGRINGARVQFNLMVGKTRRLTGTVSAEGDMDGDGWKARRKQ